MKERNGKSMLAAAKRQGSTTHFGCKCSSFGMFAVGNFSPDASSAASSTGCAFFLWLRQFDPLANVFSQNGHVYGLRPVCKIK